MTAVVDGWAGITLEELAGVREQRVVPSPDDTMPYVGLEHIAQGQPKLLGIGRAGDAVSQKTVFRAGDILFGKLRPALRKVVRTDFDGVCSTDILAIYAHEPADGPYLHQLLRSDAVLAAAVQSAEGTKMPRTSWNALRTFTFDCPPPCERVRIVEVLDAIDTAIAKTEAVLAATEELRKGLLQELLTRGVPGWHQEWKTAPGIGTVPACWEVVRLGDVAEVQTGRAVAGNRTMPADAVEVPYLSVANVKDGYLHLETVKTMRVGRSELSQFLLQKGDVLFTEGGDADKLGRGYVWEGQIDPCLHQNHVFAVRPDAGRLHAYFLATYARSWRGKMYFLGCAKQTTNLASINSTQLKDFPIPLPPLQEQNRILEVLEAISPATENLGVLRTLKVAMADAPLRVCLK